MFLIAVFTQRCKCYKKVMCGADKI